MRKVHFLALTAFLVSSVSAPALADWNNIGSLKFSGGGSQAFLLPATAHGMTSVGLRPVGDGARCTHVFASFSNGETTELRLNTVMSSSSGAGQYLPRGQIATIDIPGGEDMTQLQLTCHAEEGVRVTIDILAG